MSDTQLRIGAQTEAARLVHEAIEPIQATLEDLGTSLEAAAEGFRGAAASGLGEAVRAWFTAAEDLLPALGHYAQKLVETDQAEARTEAAQLERYARLADRLGGPR